MGPYVEGSYINVPDRTINDLRTYYGDNLGRLQEVKRKYDPENVFHFEQSIPPGAQEGRVSTDKQQGATDRRLYGLQEPKAGRQGEHR
jgi:hypothetical protein